MKIGSHNSADYSICINDDDSDEVKLGKIKNGVKHFYSSGKKLEKLVKEDETGVILDKDSENLPHELGMLLYYIVEYIYMKGKDNYAESFMKGFFVFAVLLNQLNGGVNDLIKDVGKNYYLLLSELVGINLDEKTAKRLENGEFGFFDKFIIGDTFLKRLKSIVTLGSLSFMEQVNDKGKRALFGTDAIVNEIIGVIHSS